MLHELLQSRQLEAAVSWVLREHRDELQKHADLLHAIQDGGPQSGQPQLARHLAEFLLLIGDDAGARLAYTLALPETPSPGLTEIGRLAASPQECFQPEPLAKEGRRKFYLEPMMDHGWLPQAKAYAAQRRIPPFVARLDGGRVFGLSFVPVTEDGRTCLNFFVHNPRNRNKIVNFEDADDLWIISQNSLLACFDGTDTFNEGVLIGNSENFGHWMLNHLARLALVESVPRLKGLPLVVGENVTAMQLECLRLMGIDESRLIRLRRKHLARFRTLWAPMMPFCGIEGELHWAPNLVDFLRRKLGVGRSLAAPRGRRLFVTRRNTRWRRILNESEILEFLAPWGFESLDPGTLSISRQIEIAGEAEVIMGSSGAGMNLLLFAPRNAMIIELKHQATREMDITPMLTFQIGQRYIGIVGIPMTTAESKPLDYDFEISLNHIRDALNSAGVQH